MMWDKKKELGTIIKRHRDGAGKAPSEAEMKNQVELSEGGEIDPKHLASEEMISAFHNKDPMKMKEAMSSFIDLHLHESEKAPSPKE